MAIKPNELTIIHPNHAAKILANVPVTELCGIGKNIAQFLAKYGVVYCGDMKKIPISIVAKRLRANQLQAQTFFIGVKNYRLGWFSIKAKMAELSANCN